ncbi:phage recombination protein Bet [Listeria monocytogenes]|uniref:Phage recombination protein Bet n=1 Tax=Listeria monocytogenes TaxID=1639 RepID=A0A6C8N1I4_LISMN|nr:phage recombination protein Bet [Listeria monocytogenes]KAA9534095.1 phage recombination protein Bet [Listeria monocytogenes]KAA9541480.1 phage recombination protein Bet [Listeria monocytogenes]
MSDNEVGKTTNQPTEKTTKYQVNGEDVELSVSTVRNFLVKGNGAVTDQEVVMFLNLCKYQKLNPFLNEAFLVKFGSSDAQIITSKEAFMKRAESNANFKGFEAGIIVQRGDEIVEINGAVKLPNDKLIGGWAKVYRDDRQVPITVQVALEEFDKKQSTWKQMPNTMIRKTAIVNALREAFPQDLGSMYTEDDKTNYTQQARPNTQSNVASSIFEEKINQAAKEQPEVIDAAAEDVSPEEVQDEVAGK